MPDDGLKRLTVRCDVRRVHRRHNDTGGRFFRGKSAVPANDSNDCCAGFFGELNRADQIRADIFLQIAATDGKNQQAVF